MLRRMPKRGNTEYLEHLRSVPLFQACTNKELERIAKASDELEVPAGTVLVDQGAMGRELFVIMSGSAIVRRNGKKVATVGPGAVIGELSLFDHGPRTATVTAETDCAVLVLEQRNFAAVLDTVPSVAHKMLASLAAKVREFDRKYYG
jgi:CRP/FNR family cyclic AMP-dependent transcriptional regulator